MKEFVITGLTTPELKAEAETLLKENGYRRWFGKGVAKSESRMIVFGDRLFYYSYANSFERITLTEAREMLKG